MVFQACAGVNVMIAESVEGHTTTWNAPAIQDQSGKAQLRERLQATVNFTVLSQVKSRGTL